MTRSIWLTSPDAELIAECDVQRVRGSGPGGQHRNKTESAVRLRHEPTDLFVIAEERRSQHENRERAVQRLREAFAFEWREPIAELWPSPALRALLATPITNLGKNTLASPAYLLAIGELLDGLAHLGSELGRAAATLGVSSNALTKLIYNDDRAARAVAQLRQRAGLMPLRSPRR